MNHAFENMYEPDLPATELMRNYVLLPDMSDEQARALIEAWKLGFDAGAEKMEAEYETGTRHIYGIEL